MRIIIVVALMCVIIVVALMCIIIVVALRTSPSLETPPLCKD